MNRADAGEVAETLSTLSQLLRSMPLPQPGHVVQSAAGVEQHPPAQVGDYARLHALIKLLGSDPRNGPEETPEETTARSGDRSASAAHSDSRPILSWEIPLPSTSATYVMPERDLATPVEVQVKNPTQESQLPPIVMCLEQPREMVQHAEHSESLAKALTQSDIGSGIIDALSECEQPRQSAPPEPEPARAQESQPQPITSTQGTTELGTGAATPSTRSAPNATPRSSVTRSLDERIAEWHRQNSLKLAALEAERKRREEEELARTCTFRPNIPPSSRISVGEDPGELTRSLYEEALARKRQLAELAARKTEVELAPCTFKPVVPKPPKHFQPDSRNVFERLSETPVTQRTPRVGSAESTRPATAPVEAREARSRLARLEREVQAASGCDRSRTPSVARSSTRSASGGRSSASVPDVVERIHERAQQTQARREQLQQQFAMQQMQECTFKPNLHHAFASRIHPSDEEDHSQPRPSIYERSVAHATERMKILERERERTLPTFRPVHISKTSTTLGTGSETAEERAVRLSVIDAERRRMAKLERELAAQAEHRFTPAINRVSQILALRAERHRPQQLGPEESSSSGSGAPVEQRFESTTDSAVHIGNSKVYEALAKPHEATISPKLANELAEQTPFSPQLAITSLALAKRRRDRAEEALRRLVQDEETNAGASHGEASQREEPAQTEARVDLGTAQPEPFVVVSENANLGTTYNALNDQSEQGDIDAATILRYVGPAKIKTMDPHLYVTLLKKLKGKREAEEAKAKQAREQAEIKECTFTPQVSITPGPDEIKRLVNDPNKKLERQVAGMERVYELRAARERLKQEQAEREFEVFGYGQDGHYEKVLGLPTQPVSSSSSQGSRKASYSQNVSQTSPDAPLHWIHQAVNEVAAERGRRGEYERMQRARVEGRVIEPTRSRSMSRPRYTEPVGFKLSQTPAPIAERRRRLEQEKEEVFRSTCTFAPATVAKTNRAKIDRVLQELNL